MLANISERLLSGETTMDVWGGGYIGLSTSLLFASQGVTCRIHDIDPRRVTTINSGRSGLPLFENWMALPLKPLVSAGLISATTAPCEHRRSVHLVAVPTERDGTPWSGAVENVIPRIDSLDPELCIIESTLSPGTSDRLMGSYPRLPLAVAPRRDWFLGEDRGIRSMPRVYAGTDPEVADAAAEVLSIVSGELVEASALHVVELTKCIENSLHHVAAIYATQLARSFEDYDVDEAFELATGHWRMANRYFASAGTGGHCLPVATNHLLAQGDASLLTLCAAARDFELEQRRYVAQVLTRGATGPVGILGLSYRAEVPTTVLSPFMDIMRLLVAEKVDVHVNDPYCGKAAVSGDPRIEYRSFPEIMRHCERIFLGAPHREYMDITSAELVQYARPLRAILDNEGAWRSHRAALDHAGITYRRIGEAGWTDLSH